MPAIASHCRLTIDESAALECFSEAVDGWLRIKTAEKRSPPEPDFACQTVAAEWVAFEITEAASERNVGWMQRAIRTSAYIDEVYGNLSEEQRSAYRKRFRGQPVSLTFLPEVSTVRAKKAVPDILRALLLAPTDDEGNFPDLVRDFPTVLASVRQAGQWQKGYDPTFNIGGSFDPSDVVTEAVRQKVRKTYETSLPIELVVLLGGWGAHFTEEWRKAIPRLLEEDCGLGPFRRVWIVGSSKIEAMYGT